MLTDGYRGSLDHTRRMTSHSPALPGYGGLDDEEDAERYLDLRDQSRFKVTTFLYLNDANVNFLKCAEK